MRKPRDTTTNLGRSSCAGSETRLPVWDAGKIQRSPLVLTLDLVGEIARICSHATRWKKWVTKLLNPSWACWLACRNDHSCAQRAHVVAFAMRFALNGASCSWEERTSCVPTQVPCLTYLLEGLPTGDTCKTGCISRTKNSL